MKKLAIYGAGGFGKEVACLIKHLNLLQNEWDFLGFFDDNPLLLNSSIKNHGKVLGNLNDINNWPESLHVVFSIANPIILERQVNKITNPLILFPNIIAPNALFLDKDSVSMGKGNLFFFGTRVSCDIAMGNFNLLNSHASLGHDVIMNDYNVLGPQVRISGSCNVGNGNFFGVQSIVLQGLKIGNGTKVGANSVIMRNTLDNTLYLGNPAKKIVI